MKISTKGRYSLRMVTDIARYGDGGFISLKEISERQNISKKYLEQIVPLLIRSGILRTNRGNKGGYSLSRSPKELKVGDVLRAAEGALAPVSCLEGDVNVCERASECETLFIWEGLYGVISDYLDSITIQDILDRNSLPEGGDYCI